MSAVRSPVSSVRCFHEVDRGGHFAAWEQPQLFSEELRSAFRPLRKARTDVARP